MTGRKVDGSGTAVNSKNPSPRICAGWATIEIECGPAGKSNNEAWLIWGSTTQTRGSSPHECPLKGATGVDPINVPRSNTSKKSPARNPSVIVNATTVEEVNVHGGASRLTIPTPGRHGTPPGSAGWQPATKGVWFGSNPNSYQMFREMIPARAGLLLARSASNSAAQRLGTFSLLIESAVEALGGSIFLKGGLKQQIQGSKRQPPVQWLWDLGRLRRSAVSRSKSNSMRTAGSSPMTQAS